MTKCCLAWWEHGFGRAARSRRQTITRFLSMRRRAVAGSRRLGWRQRIWRPSQFRSLWWPIARATYIPCSREDPRRSTSWCAQTKHSQRAFGVGHRRKDRANEAEVIQRHRSSARFFLPRDDSIVARRRWGWWGAIADLASWPTIA